MNNISHPHSTTNGLQLPWSWCTRCHRGYATGTYRLVQFSTGGQHPQKSTLKLCPYSDCSGKSSQDRVNWDTIREYHPEYPLQPEPNVRYGAVL